MSESLFEKSTHEFVDGQFVNSKVAAITASIKEYEPELDVEYRPPAARQRGEAAYRIVHRPVNSAPYVLFHVQEEEDFDERVLFRIIYNDQRNGKQEYDEVRAWEKAQELQQKRKFEDAIAEANDLARHIMRSPLNTYKVNDNLIVKSGQGFFDKHGNRVG